MRRSSVVLLLSVAAVALPRAVPPMEPEDLTALVGATIFDGTGAAPLPNATVILDGERIRAVGPGDRTPVPGNARVLDLSGKFVIPGLADMHNHLGHAAFGRPDYRAIFRTLLSWGVTTVLSPASSLTLSEYRMTRDIAASEPLVPRLFHVRRHFAAEGGWGGNAGFTPGSPTEVAAAMDELVEDRADAVKVIYDDLSTLLSRSLPMMSREVMEAVISSAHDHGLKVFVHAPKLEAAKEVLRAGADGLMHAVVDLPVDEEFLRLMRRSGASYMSTQAFFEASDLRALTRRIIELDPGGLEANPAYRRILTEEMFGASGPNRPSRGPLARSNLKAVFDAGIPIVIGTDMGANPALIPGIATHMELVLHVESGIPPAEVLMAATRNAARMLDLDGDQGTVEAGKLADLLILDADPLEDIRNTVRIHRIVKGGVLYDPIDLRGGGADE